MEITVTATIRGAKYDLAVDTETAIAAGLIRKGLQETLQDATAGSADPQGDIEKRLAALADGTYTFGAGGHRADPVEREARDLVVDGLRKYGWKATAARKHAADVGAESAFATLCREALARKQGVDVSKVPETDAGIMAAAKWAAVLAKAKARADAIAAARRDTPDLT